MVTRKRVIFPAERVSEKLVAHIWQSQICSNLVADTGKRVIVIYPGRFTGDRGRDFSDAVISVDSVVIRGDIEVHVKSSQWYGHGHHRDPAYNNIVLHVVMWGDDVNPTLLQNGHRIPTVCLYPFLTRTLSEVCTAFTGHRHDSSTCPEAAGYSAKAHLMEVLDIAGRQRFGNKVTKIHSELMRDEPGQVLYRNIARALGYTRNTVPFERLAERLPLRTLEEHGFELGALNRALLLGTAGLLPSQRYNMGTHLVDCVEVEKLEAVWRSWCSNETMTEADWCFYRVRPGNFPTRRLVAMSYLITRYSHSGLLNGILGIMVGGYNNRIYQRIEERLTIPGHGYWAHHYDFGSKQVTGLALLGRSKAGDMAVNIVLPFICAWGDITSDDDMREKAMDAFRDYPALQENQITRFMKQQLFSKSKVALNACLQQGLLHIFNTWCRSRNCGECTVAFNRC